MARLGDICDILNGYAFKSEKYVSEGIRIIRIANVQKGYIEDSAPVFYPEKSEDANKFLLQEGDLLMSLTGNVGRVALLEKNFLPAALNQRVACLRIKKGKEIDKGFLFNFLNSDYFENRCILASKGVAQKNMSTTWLKDFEIPDFPIDQQLKISNQMSKINDLILWRKEQIAELDQLVKSQFSEMFGDLTNNSKGYELKPLGELLLIERGGSPRPIEKYITESENGVNWIKIGDAAEGSIYITQTKEKIIPEGTKKSRYVQPGDFLLSNSMSFGRPYILTIDGYIHDGWLVLRDQHNVFDKLFLHTLLSSDYAKTSFASTASGSVVKNLNKDLVGRLCVPVPDINEQQRFADFVRKADKSKIVIMKSLEKLETLKKSLMQEYFG